MNNLYHKNSFVSFVLVALFMIVSKGAWAAEYTYLLDVNSMSVGQKLGESLIVKESCLSPEDKTCTDKVKYVTAQLGRTGRIEFPITVAGNFDVSVNIDTNTSAGGGYWGETLTVYSPDNSSISISLEGDNAEDSGSYYMGYVTMRCLSNNPQDTGLNRNYKSEGLLDFGYVKGYSSNDLRIGVQSGTGTCYINNNPFVPDKTDDPNIITLSEPNRTYNRVAVSGINDRDRLYEIKVRGLQTACTDTGTTPSGTAATISSNLNIHIPNATYQPPFGNSMNLSADLQFVSGADGSMMWKLSKYALNQ